MVEAKVAVMREKVWRVSTPQKYKKYGKYAIYQIKAVTLWGEIPPTACLLSPREAVATSKSTAKYTSSMGLKRLYRFMLQTFVPLFVMTFFICLFIVLMQFLWKYIDDLVGKGLGIEVIGELFFYAALSLIPMALPLAILLASLMTFGNLGEHFELTAMKASGVSLLKTMRPLIVLMVLIAIGAFFFQNDVLPVAQTKMWTLLYSARQKSPELDIPEGAFYDQIPGYNLYVEKKDRETGTLYDVMIYDISKGFDNASIILADSGRLATSEDKTHLFLTLWHGESFENLKEQGQSNMKNVPYRRESFTDKEILLKFDANFNRMDEDGMRNQYVGKNMAELQATIDSVGARIDSIGRGYSRAVKTAPRLGLTYYTTEKVDGKIVEVPQPPVELDHPLNIDSIFRGTTSGYALTYLNQALTKARRIKQENDFKGVTMADDRKTVRRHAIELQKKFTLSVACIIFFFIGAPLGAIIRKGGLGMPLVISVFLFIFYYIIDNTGYKQAREGRWDIIEGMWLSTAVLLPLGVFFTYKAVNDSAVFNPDLYLNFINRLLGRNEVRQVTMKEVVMEDVEPQLAIERLTQLQDQASAYLAKYQPQKYLPYWLEGFPRAPLRALAATEEHLVDYLSNSRQKMGILKLMDYPILRSLWVYHPSRYRWASWAAIVCFPIGIPLWLIGRRQQSILLSEVATIKRVSSELIPLINP